MAKNIFMFAIDQNFTYNLPEDGRTTQQIDIKSAAKNLFGAASSNRISVMGAFLHNKDFNCMLAGSATS